MASVTNGRAETNEELAIRIQNGEADLMMQLWEGVVNFVKMRAGGTLRTLERRNNYGVEAEDLVQSGFEAMCQAVKTYNPEAGAKFTTWLDLYLRSAFAEAAGYRTSKRDGLIYGDYDLNGFVPGTDDWTWEAITPDPDWQDAFDAVEDRLWNDQLHDALLAALEDCTPEEQEIIQRHYFGGGSLRKMAGDYGVSFQRVQQRERHAFRTIRRNTYKNGLDCFIDTSAPWTWIHGEHSVERLVIHRERNDENEKFRDPEAD